MREILTDLTTTGIIAASEANFSAYYLPYGTLSGGVVNTESDLVCVGYPGAVVQRGCRGTLAASTGAARSSDPRRPHRPQSPVPLA